MSAKFLTADWRDVLLLNYEIDPAVLQPMVPRGTELASLHGKSFISLVGFQFLNTLVLGVPIPFHQNFEEVNLRFYVRRSPNNRWRRGVVFIKELVPKRAVAWIARLLYNENYRAVPMSHSIRRDGDAHTRVDYSWRFNGAEHNITACASDPSRPIAAGTDDEFFAHHEWGYVRDRSGRTIEYRVDHPHWNVRTATDAALRCDAARLYGPQFVEALSSTSYSAILAEGSPVTVYRGTRLTP